MDVIEGAMLQYTAPKTSGKPKRNQWRIQALSLRGPGFVSFTCPDGLSSSCHFFFFYTNKGGGGQWRSPRGPSPRSGAGKTKKLKGANNYF